MIKSTLAVALSLALASVTSAADQIDNGLSGAPSVVCGADSLTVNFGTQKEFEGHVYVKGHYDSAGCRVDATLTDSVNITVPFTDCDLRRQRSQNPRGIFLSVTVIISFHPMFITKVDKSYNVQCFYNEIEKTVTQQLDVSLARAQEKQLLVLIGGNGTDTEAIRQQSRLGDVADQRQFVAKDGASRGPVDYDNLPEELLTLNIPMPTCKYQVLSDSSTGEAVKFATVGQTVYHQWTCEDENNKAGESPFCATVHSCNVREESGREVQLLDENGCAQDKYLLNNLVYTNDLTGGQISQVFKFADQPTLFFQCQIRLSLKEGGSCTRSSDHCPVAIRGKRSVDNEKASEVDVFSQKMTVFEIDDPITENTVSTLESDSLSAKGSVCLSQTAFSLVLALFAVVALASSVALAVVCCRPGTVKVQLSE